MAIPASSFLAAWLCQHTHLRHALQITDGSDVNYVGKYYPSMLPTLFSLLYNIHPSQSDITNFSPASYTCSVSFSVVFLKLLIIQKMLPAFSDAMIQAAAS